MNKQLFSLVIALPTLLLVIAPSLADTTPKNEIRVNPKLSQPKPIDENDIRIIDMKNKDPFCFLIWWCTPDSETQIRTPQNVPKEFREPKTIPNSIPTEKLRSKIHYQ